MKLKLEVGKTYVDKTDEKVRIVAVRKGTTGSADYIGLRSDSGIEYAEYYFESGERIGCPKYNILQEFKEPEYRWVNLYDRYAVLGTVCTIRYEVWHISKSVAEEVNEKFEKEFDGSKRIACIRVDINTGEARNEPINQGDE